MPPTHPFDINRAPANLLNYLLTLLPAEAEPAAAPAKMRKRYIMAIAHHYWEESHRPACTVANVVATLGCQNLETVVRMLQASPALQELVKPIAHALERNDQRLLGAIFNDLQLPLRRIEVGPKAREVVTAYLKPFSY